MERPYEASFDVWFHVSKQFEEFVGRNKNIIYGAKEFIPGTLRFYLYKSDISLWSHFAKTGDIPIHWHIAGLILPGQLEESFYRGDSLIRGRKVIYSNVAHYGHGQVPITPDSLTTEPFISSERFHVSELESAISKYDLLKKLEL